MVELRVCNPSNPESGSSSSPDTVTITLSSYESKLFGILIATTSHFEALRKSAVVVRVAGS
jgi:hypothetical protein